jgi:NAD(P) transhydrogenase subunit alpha
MQLSAPTETAAREKRVAISPDSIGRFKKLGFDVVVQKGAGVAAGFRDDAYTAAGARIENDARATLAGATIVAKVQPPTADEIALIPEGAILVSLMRPGQNNGLAALLSSRQVTGLALELVPRITRAQSMDVLSSQATIVGYKAVLMGAEHMPKFMPMLTTAAGNITPAKAFVLGAGVAGLQAIATARRLGDRRLRRRNGRKLRADQGRRDHRRERRHDHRTGQPAEHRAVSREPDVRAQHLRAREAAREGGKVRVQPVR